MVARAPRKRMYRTMQGRMVDIEKLRAANETVRAVGNMGETQEVMYWVQVER